MLIVRVQDLWFLLMVQGQGAWFSLRFRVRVQGKGFRVRVQGLGLMIPMKGLRFMISVLVFRAYDRRGVNRTWFNIDKIGCRCMVYITYNNEF
jgi:hypothetical protein